MKKVSVFLVLVLTLSVMLSVFIAPQSASSTSLAPDRPIVMDGTLKTADGDLLRSGVVWYEKANQNANADALNYSHWVRAKKAGLNTIRLTNWDHRHYVNGTYNNPGPYECKETYVDLDDMKNDPCVWSITENIQMLETMVGYADALGMYVIISPSRPGDYKKQYLTHFWGQVAAHFADHTNVIYEIANEPVAWAPHQYYNKKTEAGLHASHIKHLADIYTIMRTAAPETPILSLSFSNTNDPPQQKHRMLKVVENFTAITGINWQEGLDVVSFHPYGKSKMVHVNELRSNGYPVMNTEFNYPEFSNATNLPTFGGNYPGQKFEEIGISWMNFRAGRSDGRFTEFYEFVNDAKAKGYYWNEGVEVVDELDDWTKVYDKSSNMKFQMGNPPYFGGDESRASRENTDQGYIVYHSDGLGQFNVRIYSNNDFKGIQFYVSHNGDDWENIATSRSNTSQPVNGWIGSDFTSKYGFPSGTNFVKIELNSKKQQNDTQISKVSFTAWENEGFSHLEDRMNAWSVVEDHYNLRFGNQNNQYFNGDSSRLRLDDDSEDGYAIYKLENMGGFYVKLFYKQTIIPKSELYNNIIFSSSVDGITWTPVTMDAQYNQGQDPVVTGNGWRLTRPENAEGLPEGTQYLKIEFKEARIQLGEIDIYGKY